MARVAILLSSYNGARFLPEQLASIAAQQHADWVLFWRDDGSADATPAILRGFAPQRSVAVAGPAGRLGVLASYLTLLRAALPTLAPDDAVAFADQDDVWLPHKLARGVAALAAAPPGRPVLYCARQMLVDAALRPLGPSAAFNRPPGFPAALTQNVATGCTILLNRAAAALVAGSRPPAGTLHDWWSYLLVTAAGGTVVADDTPVLLYRQHGGNTVGATRSHLRRALAALRRGPRPFMADFLRQALAGGVLRRLPALRLNGLRRNGWREGLLFNLWFLIG
jgi:glycosyltransferase involved in cell wall biosynthesis